MPNRFAAMDSLLDSLHDFEPKAIFVLGPEDSLAQGERRVLAVSPRSLLAAGTAVAESDIYGWHWRQSGASLVAWKNLNGPQSRADRKWIQPWLDAGAKSLVRSEFTLPFEQGFECFAMLGASLQSTVQAAEVCWSIWGYWPSVRAEIMAGRLGISERERNILLLLADGRTARKASQELECSERTVTFHLSNVMEKLGADNRAAAVKRAAALGLI